MSFFVFHPTRVRPKRPGSPGRLARCVQRHFPNLPKRVRPRKGCLRSTLCLPQDARRRGLSGQTRTAAPRVERSETRGRIKHSNKESVSPAQWPKAAGTNRRRARIGPCRTSGRDCLRSAATSCATARNGPTRSPSILSRSHPATARERRTRPPAGSDHGSSSRSETGETSGVGIFEPLPAVLKTSTRNLIPSH